MIPIIYEMGYYHLLSGEEWMLALLDKILPKATVVFVDVGMNIGQTMLKVNAINDQMKYIGFEPNPACNYYCEKLVQKNNFKHCTIYPVGLFDKTEILTLYLDMDIASGASVLPSFRKNKSRYKLQQQVPVFKGDDILFSTVDKVDVLKADVEGVELEVLQGLLKIIERDKPVIILEILPFYDASSENGSFRKNRMEALFNLLRSFDYQFYLINEQAVMLEQFQTLGTHDDMSKTNFIFLTKAQAAKINDCISP